MREPFYIYRGDGLVIIDNSKLGEMGGDIMIPMELFDELVVMRYAQLTAEEIAEAEKRAIDKHTGNAGVSELSKKYGLPGFMDIVQQEIDNIQKSKNQEVKEK
jgi:hypothetical protein